MSQHLAFNDMHWMADALQSIEVGLIVIDSDSRIIAWNSFMEHHSGISSTKAMGLTLQELPAELPIGWLQWQLEAVRTLKIPVYSTWKQQPYLFRFNSYRPITGSSEFMYQNVTFQPLGTLDGGAPNICITLYDVTQTAVSEREMNRLNKELEQLSRTDRMTGLYNRGHWEELASREFKRCQRYGDTSTLVMLDIDHFKRVNDTYGHQVGDEVIKGLADILSHEIRESDMAGRYGGEEFAILLSETDIEGAHIFCERVRANVEQTVVSALGESVRFTVSLGLSDVDGDVGSLETWLKEADAALYYSKAQGRNRVTEYKLGVVPLSSAD
ncbi:MAG: diguanylate cyclase [Motiliproteus sp.]